MRGFRSTDFPVRRLCEVFGPQTFRWGDCARFSGHRLSGGAFVRVFRPTIFPLGRLCEVLGPQTFRWGDCARFSPHRLFGRVIVRVFQATRFPLGRLCEVLGPQTFRWGDCASLSDKWISWRAKNRDDGAKEALRSGSIFAGHPQPSTTYDTRIQSQELPLLPRRGDV